MTFVTAYCTLLLQYHYHVLALSLTALSCVDPPSQCVGPLPHNIIMC